LTSLSARPWYSISPSGVSRPTARPHFGPGRGDGRFGGPVGVEHPAGRLRPALDEFGRTGLAADHQSAHQGQVGLDGDEHRRYAVQDGDSVAGEEFRESRADAPVIVRPGDDGRAGLVPLSTLFAEPLLRVIGRA